MNQLEFSFVDKYKELSVAKNECEIVENCNFELNQKIKSNIQQSKVNKKSTKLQMLNCSNSIQKVSYFSDLKQKERIQQIFANIHNLEYEDNLSNFHQKIRISKKDQINCPEWQFKSLEKTQKMNQINKTQNKQHFIFSIKNQQIQQIGCFFDFNKQQLENFKSKEKNSSQNKIIDIQIQKINYEHQLFLQIQQKDSKRAKDIQFNSKNHKKIKNSNKKLKLIQKDKDKNKQNKSHYENHCNCNSGCKNNRCSCCRINKKCSQACNCYRCQNQEFIFGNRQKQQNNEMAIKYQTMQNQNQISVGIVRSDQLEQVQVDIACPALQYHFFNLIDHLKKVKNQSLEDLKDKQKIIQNSSSKKVTNKTKPKIKKKRKPSSSLKKNCISQAQVKVKAYKNQKLNRNLIKKRIKEKDQKTCIHFQ